MSVDQSNAGYAAEAPVLLDRYERFRFEDVHAPILHLLPEPCAALDIGAGTGRDAAALSDRGFRVTAVEPTIPLLEGAKHLHPDPGITWIRDGLPGLDVLRAAQRRFGLIMMTAVFMHLDHEERAEALANLASLAEPGAVMALSLRHGPVPKGRRMFEVDPAETIRLAGSHGFERQFEERRRSLDPQKKDVDWTRLVFLKCA